ncbi:MAG: glycoside hydrolase family 3 N-terminal domain-containing protein [Nocardioidaceae bacterium]
MRPLLAVLALLLGISACAEPSATHSTTQAHRQRPGPGAGVPGQADAGAGSSSAGAFRPAPVATGWGPTRAEIDRAHTLVGRLSLRERAGQVIVADYRGTAAPTRLVNGLHLGGVIALGENYAGNAQIRHSNRVLQRSARAAGRRFPVLVGVDQEGGLVERVTGGTRFPAFMTAGAADNPRLTTAAYAGSGAELTGLGFTTGFAPDADVTSGPGDAAIGSRSAGSRPALVARQAVAAARGFARSGVLPVLKHFPGHGALTTDSHVALPVQRASVPALMHRDLRPFRAGIDAGLPAVMVGHIDVRSVDPGVPASLSKKVVTGLLRHRLGFRGLAISDALNMGAITGHYGVGRSAVLALRAGEDVLLMPSSPRTARDAIVRAVRQGRLSQSRLDQAAIREVALLLHQRHQGSHPAVPGSAAPVSRRLSAGGITVVKGSCRSRLVGPRVRLLGSGAEVAAFRAAARGSGLRYSPHGTRVALVGYQEPVPPRPDVLVAMDRPYLLGQAHAAVAKVATYGATPGAMHALVDVLTGRAPAPGRLPVPVRGVARPGC